MTRVLYDPEGGEDTVATEIGDMYQLGFPAAATPRARTPGQLTQLVACLEEGIEGARRRHGVTGMVRSRSL